ncbi:tRNA lysidine(34) synthetase TilS [Spiroplasma endosymbiont of Anurida maritima]|uniref:tRNA lysidine(34) synthetase TilS n=1 Tax=Spiroplasma endosymbiont of Anurida maritima TaxID=2967972 RepID=UPI0036D2671C
MKIKFNKKMFDKNKQYIIAVSGGPDSVFLLDYFVQNISKNIIIATVDYCKRKGSDFDFNLVKSYANKNNLKFLGLKCTKNVYGQYKQYKNFQEQARKIRYDFFNKILKDCNLQTGVIVAHNLTDNIETFLIQKERKTVVEHYGLNETSYYYNHNLENNNQLKVFRPMLNVKRETIIKYLEKHKIAYAIDESNAESNYLRNYIRNNVLKTKNYKQLLKSILKSNEELMKIKNTYKNLLGKTSFNINLYNNLSLLAKPMFIYSFIKEKNMEKLLVDKKKKFVLEIVKQLDQEKHNVLISLGLNYYFCKNYKDIHIIKIDDNDVYNKLDESKIHYKTNDRNIFTKLNYKKVKLNKIIMKSKIPLLEIINGYVIYDKKGNVIDFSNNIKKAMLNKYL